MEGDTFQKDDPLLHHKELVEHTLINNMLQISDFFQCKEALRYSIENMTIHKDSAVLNIREGLKKIQSSVLQGGVLRESEGGLSVDSFKECWFTLIQKSINVAAQSLETPEDL
jgi:hypothetical protein